MECNICGGREFTEASGRVRQVCGQCGANERTRLAALYLAKFADLRPGKRVLHFAPEDGLFHWIAERVGSGYEIRDLDVARYAKLQSEEVSVQQFDLCADTGTLPSDTYDLVLHNHVMEHLPCNITAVLWHLHRAVKPGGLHMFSVPVLHGRWGESFKPEADTREAQFGHPEHMRFFGREDLTATIGMVFDIDEQVRTPLTEVFPVKELRRFNIPEDRWQHFTGANLFVLPKDSLKLR